MAKLIPFPETTARCVHHARWHRYRLRQENLAERRIEGTDGALKRAIWPAPQPEVHKRGDWLIIAVLGIIAAIAFTRKKLTL